MLSAHSWAGGTRLTGETLEFGVRALADATLTRPPAVADLLVAGHAGAVVQRAVTGASAPKRIADAHSAVAGSMALKKRFAGYRQSAFRRSAFHIILCRSCHTHLRTACFRSGRS